MSGTKPLPTPRGERDSPNLQQLITDFDAQTDYAEFFNFSPQAEFTIVDSAISTKEPTVSAIILDPTLTALPNTAIRDDTNMMDSYAGFDSGVWLDENVLGISGVQADTGFQQDLPGSEFNFDSFADLDVNDSLPGPAGFGAVFPSHGVSQSLNPQYSGQYLWNGRATLPSSYEYPDPEVAAPSSPYYSHPANKQYMNNIPARQVPWGHGDVMEVVQGNTAYPLPPPIPYASKPRPNLQQVAVPQTLYGPTLLAEALQAPLFPETPTNTYAHRLRNRAARPSPINTSNPEFQALERARRDVHRGYVELSDGDSPLSDCPDSARPRRKAAGRNLPFGAEAPKKDAEHDWVRINHSTAGKSTRTGKINKYDPKKDGKYRDFPHPIGPWRSSTGFTFEYDAWGELKQTPRRGETAGTCYTTEQIRQFIHEHPSTSTSHLILWIQKTPADSAKRYPTEGGDRCRFQDCPGHVHKRNIGVGLYRVAFDEKWATHGARTDPFVVAGYAHLYCVERFLDLPDLCRRFDVRADNRQLSSEPRGRFGPRLGDTKEFAIANDFISRCRNGALGAKFPAYPVHGAVAPGARKEHKGTLTWAMTAAKNGGVAVSKRRMLESRGLKASHILVHVGDLAMQIEARQREKLRKRGAGGRGEESEGEDVERHDEVEGVEQVVRVAPPREGKGKRSMPESEVEEHSEDEDGDSDFVPGRRGRWQKRARQGQDSDSE